MATLEEIYQQVTASDDEKAALAEAAKTPEGLQAFLSERGYPDARAVHSAEESLIFALPPELRRDLRAAQQA